MLTESGTLKANYSGFNREEWQPRTGNAHKADSLEAKSAVHDAERQRLEANGSRWSSLFSLDYFDPILHHTIDPMHCLYLGIAKTMTKHYLQSGLISQHGLSQLQNVMDTVRVPQNIGRIPRKIVSGFASFTADQWKNWTLVYSSSALRNILPNEHLKVWLKFVHGTSLLTKKILRLEDLELADSLLVSFCSDVQRLYGEGFIKPNFHMACHLVEVIKQFGPVYSFWCYSFER